jgi:N-acetylglutamate synthase-like GNAT family acetyltransferase
MIRSAEPEDLPAVLALLTEASLPTEGVVEHFRSFFVLEQDGRIVASAGLELRPTTALVRSLVVAPDSRGAGLGAAVLRRALHDAHERAAAVYALTTTAETYLTNFGFERVTRESLPDELFESPELRGACPDSAVVMKKGEG